MNRVAVQRGVAALLTLSLGACMAASPPEPPAGESPSTAGSATPDSTAVAPTASAVGPVDDRPECERMGYPCSLAETPPELVERTVELLQEAHARRGQGAMSDALAYLAAQPDVVEAFGDDDALVFRTEGAPEAWLIDTSDTSGGAAAGPDITLASALSIEPRTRLDVQQSVVGEDTSGDSKIDNRDDKRALVLSPYHWQFKRWHDPSVLVEQLEQLPGYAGNVRHVVNDFSDDENVSLRDYQSFDQYDVIYLSTHGKRACGVDDDGGEICKVVIGTGIHLDDLPASMGVVAVGNYNDMADLQSSIELNLGLLPDFFRVSYPDGLDDTLLMLSACETGSAAGNQLAAAAGGENFVMTGWSEAVPAPAAFAAAGLFVEQLGLSLSTREAHNAVVEASLHLATRDGVVTEFEYISPGGDNLRLFELPTVYQDGEPMPEGADVTESIDGTPGDGDPDRLSIELRLAGVHEPGSYTVHYEIDEMLTPGTYDLSGAIPGDMPFSYIVQHEVDVGFDLPAGEFSVEAIVDLPEGGESRYFVPVTSAAPTAEACSLIDTATLNNVLGTAFDEFGPTPFGNTCKWTEPLIEGWTKNEFGVAVLDERSGDFLEGVLEEKPEWRVDGELPAGIEAAYYEGASDPISVGLGDGVVWTSAGANFYFKTRGVWIGLTPSGEVGLEPDLESRVLAVAGHVAQNFAPDGN